MFGGRKTSNDTINRKKLKRLNWVKIPDIQIMGAEQENIWKEVQTENPIKVDFQAIEDLFAVQDRPSSASRRSPTQKLSSSSSASSLLDGRSSPNDVKTRKVSLLDSKRSLNVNIFLRQFKRSTAVLAESIKSCDVSFMNSDKLRALRKLLPDKHEIKTLLEYSGDVSLLDNAESFLRRVISIPHYHVRIDAMLLREEFDHAMSQVEHSIEILVQAIKEIRRCRALPAILHLVLQAGNYLNQGATFGNASGFRLASLQTLSDTKANKPGITLMHYVAMELNKSNPHMMSWVNEIPSVDNASRISEEELTEEIRNYRIRVTSLKNKVTIEVDSEFRDNVSQFLEEAENRLNLIRSAEENLSDSSKELATYLCERHEKFSLIECFQIVSVFRKKFKDVTEDNIKREAKKKSRQTTRVGQIRTQMISDRTTTSTDLKNPGNQTEVTQGQTELGKFKRSNTISTPHQRYQGLTRQDKVSDETTENRRSRLRKYDLSHIRRSSLAKPSPTEILKLYQQSTVSDDGSSNQQSIEETAEPPEERRQAWMQKKSSENLSDKDLNLTKSETVKTDSKPLIEEKVKPISADTLSIPTQRRRRTGSMRSRSLRNGLWDNYDGPDEDIIHHLSNHVSKDDDSGSVRSRHSSSSREDRERPSSVACDLDDDLESSLNRIMTGERERAFERTQLRRSYIRLGSLPSDGSDSDTGLIMTPSRIRRRLGQRRSSPLAQASDASISSGGVNSKKIEDFESDPFSSSVTQALEGESSNPAAASGVVDRDSKRHDDLRERIRRYKESTSSGEDLTSTSRRRSSNTSLTEYLLKRKESMDSRSDSSCSQPESLEPESQVNDAPKLPNQRPLRSGRSSLTRLSVMNETIEEQTVPLEEQAASVDKPAPTDNTDAKLKHASEGTVFEGTEDSKEDSKSSLATEEPQQEEVLVVALIGYEQTSAPLNDQEEKEKEEEMEREENKVKTAPNTTVMKKKTLKPPSTPSPTRRPKTPVLGRKQYDTSPAKSSTSVESSPDRQNAPKSRSQTPTSKTAQSKPTPTKTANKGPTVTGVKTFIKKLAYNSPKSNAKPPTSGTSGGVKSKPATIKPGLNAKTLANQGSVNAKKDKTPVKTSLAAKSAAKTTKPLPKGTRSPSPGINSTPVRIVPRPSTLHPSRQTPSKNSSLVSCKPASRLVSPVAQRTNRVATPSRDSNPVPKTSRKSATGLPPKNTKKAAGAKKPSAKSATVRTTPEPVSEPEPTVKVEIVPPSPDESVPHDSDNKENDASSLVDAAETQSVCSESSSNPIKETDLSDNQTPKKETLKPSHSGSSAPRSGVQLNRAARLRLSKKNMKKNSSNSAVFV
uniref:FH2 domain-containing protein 1 n=1 Tax=Phallusia mammillata TaxID=59560 RepID=A0A6F9DDL8_9ASCI|nr:FH2 domain-containing protein 1 [Phallusia mammillata]